MNPRDKQSYFDEPTSNSSSSSSSSSSQQLSRPVQRHLARVYGTLAGVSSSAALGSLAHMNRHWIAMSLSPSAASILGLLVFAGVQLSRPRITAGQQSPSSGGGTTQLIRLAALLVFGLLQGISVGPLLYSVAHYLNPSIIPQALLLTTLIFGSFTGAALTAQRRSWLYMGGMLMSGLNIMLGMSLFSLLFGGASGMLFSAELYLGLAVFAGFVAYDTQSIVERADAGDMDYVSHGGDLFVDLFALFVRIIVILSRKEEGDRKRRKDE